MGKPKGEDRKTTEKRHKKGSSFPLPTPKPHKTNEEKHKLIAQKHGAIRSHKHKYKHFILQTLWIFFVLPPE